MPSRRRRVRQRRSLPSPEAASRLRAEALHRASAQAGRPVVVLTYSVYAPLRHKGRALRDAASHTAACQRKSTSWRARAGRVKLGSFLNSPFSPDP